MARTTAFAGADGVWLITANSGGDRNSAAAGFTLADWRQIVTNIAGPNAKLATEDNPFPYARTDQSYRDARSIIGGSVAVLTRSYVKGGTTGNWKAETDRALANPKVSAVAMETTDLPGQDVVGFVRAAGGVRFMVNNDYDTDGSGADGRVPLVAGQIPSAVADDANSYGPNVVPISVKGTGANLISADVSSIRPIPPDC